MADQQPCEWLLSVCNSLIESAHVAFEDARSTPFAVPALRAAGFATVHEHTDADFFAALDADSLRMERAVVILDCIVAVSSLHVGAHASAPDATPDSETRILALVRRLRRLLHECAVVVLHWSSSGDQDLGGALDLDSLLLPHLDRLPARTCCVPSNAWPGTAFAQYIFACLCMYWLVKPRSVVR